MNEIPPLLPPGLPRRQARFVALLAVQPSLTRVDYQTLAGISRNTAQHDLEELVATRLIRRLGRGPSCRYCLVSAHNLPDITPSSSLPEPAAAPDIFSSAAS